MDILILLLIALGIGYVWGKSANATKANEARLDISNRLHQLASEEEDKKTSNKLHNFANTIRDEVTLLSATAAAPSTPPKEQPSPQTIEAPRPAAVEQAFIPADKTKQHLDSVSVLLYFGAFLLLAGVALFVGLSDFDGVSKTLAVMVLAAIFYGSGLYLYEKIERLKPASIAFTAIGLLALPLAGVAAYSYVFAGSGAAVWFITSALSLALYVLALWKIRQSFIGYLSVFMGLSLWLSIVAVVSVPVYYFGWAAILLGMAYLIIAQRARTLPELEQPLSVSASVMVPTAAILLLFAGDTISLTNQGISLGLTALFYALACWLEKREDTQQAYYFLAYALAPAAIATVTHGVTKDLVATGFSMTATAAAGTAFLWLVQLPNSWRQISLSIHTVLLILAGLFCLSTAEWQALANLLLINLVVFGVVAYRWRRAFECACAFLTLLFLPLVLGFGVAEPHWTAGSFSLVYLGLAVGTLAGLHFLRRQRSLYRVAAVAFAIFLGMAELFGVTAADGLPAAISLAVGLIALGFAYLERFDWAITATAGMVVIALLQFLFWQQQPVATMVYSLAALGVAYVAIGRCHHYFPAFSSFRDVWIASGIVLLYLTAFFALVAGGNTQWPAVTALVAAALATGFEAWMRRERMALYVAGGVLLAAFEFALAELGFFEWQVYWYLWTAYLLFFGYRERIAAALPVAGVLLLAGITHGLATHDSLNAGTLTVALLGVSLVYYAASRLLPLWPEGKVVLAYSGIAGAYFAAVFPAGFNSYDMYSPTKYATVWLNAISLMAAGALTSYEAYTARNRSALYISGGVVLIGLQWLLHTQSIREIQLYTHMWAAYFGLLAWHAWREQRPSERQIFTGLALGVLTVPLALEALAGNTAYGLLLLFEGTGLVLVGLWLKDTLVSRWGLAVAVGSVLYQLRDYQFFVLALLGAGIIALSVYMLLRREKQ